MIIKEMHISDLNAAVYNPRKDLKASDPEYVKLRRSIENFGYVDPIIVNERNNTVVGGHQRLKVLKDLGYKSIECVMVDLDDTSEKALNVALNKISGDWDADKLEDLLREIQLDSDFDIELTGFDMGELDTLFSGSLEEVERDLKSDRLEVIGDDDNLEEIDEVNVEKNERGIKQGDVYKLGRHTLMCGDSTNKDDVLKLMGDNNIELCMTDPPYPQGFGVGSFVKSLVKLHNNAEIAKKNG